LKKHKVRTVLSALAFGIGLIAVLALHYMGFDLPAMWCVGLASLGFVLLMGWWRWAAAFALAIVYFAILYYNPAWLDTLAGGVLKALAPWLVFYGAIGLISSGKKSALEDDRMPKLFPEDPGDKPVQSLTVQKLWGTEYQLFRGKEHLYIVWLNPYPEPIEGLLIDSEEAFKPGRHNAAIPFNDILSVQINPGRAHHPPVRIRTRERRWRFTLLEYTKREDLEKFFAGLPLTVLENGFRSYEHQPDPTPEQVKRFAPYRNASIALSALGAAAATLWLSWDAAYRPLAFVNLLLLIAAFALYLASFAASQPMKHKGLSQLVTLNWIFPAIALFVRALYDYRIDAALKVAPPAAAIWLAFAAILLLFLRRKKPELNRVLAALLCAAALCWISAIHLNGLLDDGSRAASQLTQVEYKHISREFDRPTEYILGVGGKFWGVNASRALYDQVEEGDAVRVGTRTGALGIPYSFVEAADES
jgi:hypothetical protein